MQPRDRTTRQHLAWVTHDIHEVLHHDPVLCRLAALDLTLPAYHAALSAFGTLYGTVEAERARLQVYDQFALHAECAALAADVPAQCTIASNDLSFGCGMELLGALYVTHGASFGRGTFRGNVMSRLPQHPHRFVQRKADPAVWKALVAELEMMGQCAAQLQAIETGAQRTFAFMQSTTRRLAPRAMAKREVAQG